MQDVLDALVDRHAAAEAEDQHGDDQAPEEQFLAVAERMLGRRLAWLSLRADQQQHAVERIDRRMTASDSIAALPVMPATMNLVTAIAMFAAIAP